MNLYRRFIVYPIKENDLASVGIVEVNREEEIVGRYGLFIGPASQTDIFRHYSKFILERLEVDEIAVVHSFHLSIKKKKYEYPRLRYDVREGVKRYSYCYQAAMWAHTTQANTYETIKHTKMEEL